MTKIPELEELFNKHCNTAEERKQQDNKTYDCSGGRSYGSKGAVTGSTVSQGSRPDATGTLVSTASTESKSLVRSEKEKQSERLTKAELADKRSKGLCLKCDQKFTHRHSCASRTLQVLLVDKENFADMAKVSLSSVGAGSTDNPRMRLKGILGRENIVVLIDSGSSDNLISANLVERLGIMVTETDAFSSHVANGEIVSNQGICQGVIISFPELQVVEDFLQFKMGNARNYDVILGIKWLKTLGHIMVNYQLFTMTFGSETGRITLKGDPVLCPSSRVPAKSMAGKHRSDIDFKVGDLVFLKLYRCMQQTVARKPNKKLAPNFYGPYLIISRVGKVGYELKVPNAPNIRPLFHVSQLKRATTADTSYSSIPVVLTEDMAVMLTPERLKGVRSGDLQNPATCKVLIKWKNYEATWESFSSIRKQFPEFHLEEKLAVWVGGFISKTL